MSQIKLKHSGGNGVIIAAPSSNPAADRTLLLPSNADGTVLTNTTPGCVLQVKQAVKTDVSSTSNASFSDISNLSVNITPTSSSSKIYVSWHGTMSSNTDKNGHIRLVRDSNELIYVGDTGESNQARVTNSMTVHGEYGAESFAGNFLDSPNTTSQITYKLKFAAAHAVTIYIGRMSSNENAFSRSRQPASITVMEVSA